MSCRAAPLSAVRPQTRRGRPDPAAARDQRSTAEGTPPPLKERRRTRDLAHGGARPIPEPLKRDIVSANPRLQRRDHGWNDSKSSTVGDKLSVIGLIGTTAELDAWRALATAWTHARGDTSQARLNDWNELADALGLGGRT